MQDTHPLSRFTPLVIDDPAPQGLGVYPYEFNQRIPLSFSVHESPDPATQAVDGARIAHRPSQRQAVGFFHPYDYVMEERFTFADLQYAQMGAWIPPGYMEPFDLRTNIELPGHVAYGSLFQTTQPTYGYG